MCPMDGIRPTSRKLGNRGNSDVAVYNKPNSKW